ncbi:SGNH/GDSL hydrolase family protein [Limosilactobacillus pulli]|uniref:SGNH/GDSL hydrolase family protein n=1 Tax=Limosilactobacillus pulli TaxID=2991833 RepID=UPI0024B8A5D6|nr:SGNH/GDSL hydrolase family protein [Limosilactobacillus pulli]
MGWQIAYSRLPHDFSGLPFKMKKLTQLIKITPQVSGDGLRLQLHNHFGDEPLVFDRLEVSDNEKMQGAKMITRGGQTRIVIASHGTAQTDTLPFQVTAGQPLYFRMCATCNQSYVDFSCVYDETFYNAINSNSTTATPRLPHNWQARKGWFCISCLEVWTAEKMPIIELTGDSSAETGMIETGLIKQLLGQGVVVNTGISGNRLLHDAPQDGPLYQTFGQALLKRVTHPVYSFPHPVIALIGSNDLVLPLIDAQSTHELVTPIQYLAGVSELKHILDERHCPLILTTIPPFSPRVDEKQAGVLLDAQQRRLLINEELIKFPWVVDLDPLLLDDKGGLKKIYDFGDHLHLNEAGGMAVARAILRKIGQLDDWP